MVKQFVSPVRVYKYPFELTVVAYQTRFPYNARIPIMLSSQMLEEHVSEDRTREKKVRRCTLKIEMPYLMRKISGLESGNFRTTTELDWAARRFVVTSINETFSSRLKVIETCIFSVHQDNEAWTCYEQDFSVEMLSVWGFEAQAEKLAIDRYIARLPKTKEVMDLFVDDVHKAGLHVPEPYVAPVVAEPATSVTPSHEAVASCLSDRRKSSLAPSEVVMAADTSSDAATASASSTECERERHLPAAAATSSAASAGNVPAPSPGAAASASASEKRSRHMRRDSSVMDSDKLEGEYIQRFLGELTPYQESNLIQLRQKLSSTLKEKMPNDAVLLRFLRARDFNIDKARDMVSRHVAWRKQYQVDRLVDTWIPSDTIKHYYAGGWHHYDRKGHPVYVIRLGQVDVKGMLKAFGEADLLKQVLVDEEEGLRQCEQLTRNSDKAISTVTLICDLEGLSLRHLWRPGIRALDRIIQVLLNNYPETMGRLLFVRAPRVFPVLWAIVSQFLDEATREKFVFYAANDYQAKVGGLTDYIAPDYVPDFLGGPCHCSVPAGGHVPKELYRKGVEEFSEPEDGMGCALDTAYQMASITKDRPCEVVLPVDCDSILVWDFDVSRGKVYFSVLRVNTPLGPDQENEAATSMASSVTTLSTANSSIGEDGLLDSRQELSEAQHVVGPDLYQDNDSVQGTYTVNRSGIYLIRWELCHSVAATQPGPPPHHAWSPAVHTLSSSPPAGQGASLLSDRFSGRKANLMYYLEVIQPDRFKGSVSSLESWQSAVSSLSLDPSLAEESSALAVKIPPLLTPVATPTQSGMTTPSLLPAERNSTDGTTRPATMRSPGTNSLANQPVAFSEVSLDRLSVSSAPPLAARATAIPIVHRKQRYTDV